MFDKQQYFIREHVGMLKLADTYDILDPATQEQLAIAKEKPGALVHILRFLFDKQSLPTTLFVYGGSDADDESALLFSVKRPVTFFRTRVDVIDSEGQLVGYFKRKIMALKAKFMVYDSEDQQVAMVKGDWKGWNFSFLDADEQELGQVTKQWSGLGKELFTSADNYMISLTEAPNPHRVMLLLAAGLAIDIVIKEN